MRISYDPAKRQKTPDERGLDFEDPVVVFDGLTFEVDDTRQDYGETRVIWLRTSRRALGRNRLYAARYCPSHFQHEKSQ